jgi:alpha-ketoglutarate-dependent 2,4-dichlorophenoxyacetate dioxygenase
MPAMPMTVKQIHKHFVGEISGLDLREPVASDDAVALNQALDRYGVLVFRGQHITDEEQLTFTRSFGEIELAIGGNVTKPSERRLDVKLADVSNLDQHGKVMAKDDRRRMFNLGNRLWHSDSSYRAVPAKCSLLSCRSKPSKGGNTEFAFMPAAYDALDDETKAEIDGLVAVHSLIYSRGQLGFGDFSAEEMKTFASVRQALVRTNDFTGRKSVFLSAHIGTIVGWEMPEARDFIRELTEHATQPEFVHAHEWEVGDLVVWDNRQCMHRVRPFKDTDEPRDMRRTTVAGSGQTAEQAADQAA